MNEVAYFTPLDWTVLVGYFVGITAFGLWISRKIRTSGGYFLGERQLPWWVMIGQSFGTGTHAENPVAQAGATYQYGFATIWYQWKNMLITPFYWLMAPWYRRCERTTIGEMVGDRYGRGMALLYTLFALSYFVFNQGAMLKGAGKAISVATGGEMISANGVVVAMVGAFLLYSLFGGLVASAYTDFVQGFLIIAMSFMLIPLGLFAVGGFTGMRDSLPADFFQLYSPVSRIDAFTIAMLTLNGFIGITAQPHILTMNATGKTERAGRVGQTYGSFVKRFCTIGWALTGLVVAAMLVQRGVQLEDKEHAFGYACLHLLCPGLTGLMVACILAANMSTCSNFMVNSAALFTQNVYREYVRPHAADRELLAAGRASGFLLTLGGVVFALYVNQVLDAFLFNETLPCMFGLVILAGILWRRSNRYGALAGVLVALLVYYGLNYVVSCGLSDPKPQGLRDAMAQLAAASQEGTLSQWLASGSIKLVYPWLPAPFGWSMLIGSLALVVVSLLTPAEDAARVARFFDNMRRSTDDEGLPAGAPKPLAAERGQDLILLDLPGWLTAARWRDFFRRYREDLVGFAVSWCTVGLLILGAWGLMQIGR
jgi:Na+/proline symporter